jgi:hypothetical protein
MIEINNIEKLETSFLGLKIEEGGPNSDDIKKALGSSMVLLDIQKFMEAVKFEKDPIMTDYFWQVLVEERCTTQNFNINRRTCYFYIDFMF